MTKEALNKQHKITKGRGNTSLKKLAESFMSTANKVWTAIIGSVIVIPLSGIMKSMFFESTLTADGIYNGLITFSTLLLVIYFFGIYLAVSSRGIALDIYDYLDKQ